MASGQTANYQLNQWEAEDKVLRTEFNADNQKIDAALAGLASAALKMAVGTYTGDGAASRVISVGFTPKAVLVCTQSGLTYSPNASGYVYGGLALIGQPVCYRYKRGMAYPYEYFNAVELTTEGFQVCETKIDDYAGVYCNSVDTTYHYFAIG